MEGDEPPELWAALGGGPSGGQSKRSRFVVPTHKTKLHEALLGDGFLELPQARPAGRAFLPTILRSDAVFIVDDFTDIFIWIGKHSARLLRVAASRLASELETLIPRPSHVMTTVVNEVRRKPPIFSPRTLTRKRNFSWLLGYRAFPV